MTYSQHDHSHCWSKDTPPCGQKIKHFECCLCKKQHPDIEAERQKCEEMVERLKMTADDVWKVGDHYWGGDYEPSYLELERLAESYNNIMERKLTHPNKKYYDKSN